MTKNNTYVQNPEYPNAYVGTANFMYTVVNIPDDVCFIRLDFVKLELIDTYEANGDCSDKLEFV